MTTTATPATDKQLIYLAVLVESRDVDLNIPDVLDEATAAQLIDQALAAPRLHPAPRGHYLFEDRVYLVRTSKLNGHNYAVVLQVQGEGYKTGRWMHAPTLVTKLRDELTVAEAARRGRTQGICHVCAGRLVRGDDIAAGIHPRCTERLEK